MIAMHTLHDVCVCVVPDSGRTRQACTLGSAMDVDKAEARCYLMPSTVFKMDSEFENV